MSILAHLYDTDWSQRADVESLKDGLRELRSRGRGPKNVEDRVAELEVKVRQLSLITEALHEVLAQHGISVSDEMAR